MAWLRARRTQGTTCSLLEYAYYSPFTAIAFDRRLTSTHAQVGFDWRPNGPTETSFPTHVYRFSDDWLEGSGWGKRKATFGSRTAWPRPQWLDDHLHGDLRMMWPQPCLLFNIRYEVPLEVLEETFTSHGWRCECGFEGFGEVKKALVRKKQLTWSAQRGYIDA